MLGIKLYLLELYSCLPEFLLEAHLDVTRIATAIIGAGPQFPLYPVPGNPSLWPTVGPDAAVYVFRNYVNCQDLEGNTMSMLLKQDVPLVRVGYALGPVQLNDDWHL